MTLSEDILAIPYHDDWGHPSENILVGDERNVITFRRALKLAADLARDSDLSRLTEWLRDPNRKPPALAFSAGVDREVADMMVVMISE